jgi:hypothetical protein
MVENDKKNDLILAVASSIGIWSLVYWPITINPKKSLMTIFAAGKSPAPCRASWTRTAEIP